jgi:hypothetical protein
MHFVLRCEVLSEVLSEVLFDCDNSFSGKSASQRRFSDPSNLAFAARIVPSKVAYQ